MSHCSMSNLHIGSIETLHGFSPQRQVNGVNVNMVEHNNQVIAELSSKGDKVVVVLKIGSDTMAASIERVHNTNGGIIWVGAQKPLSGGLLKMEVVKDGVERPEPDSGFYYEALLRLESDPTAKVQSPQQDKENFDITVSYEGTNTTKFKVGPDMRVDQLQKEIHGKMGLRPNQYSLKHNGKSLQNGNCLRSYGIKDGSALFSYGRNRGG